MDAIATTDDIIFNFQNKFQIYKDGRIERFVGEDIVPPSPHSDTGVRSKDVVISPEAGLSGRLFLPEITNSADAGKLPFLLYIHGGAFCIMSPFSTIHHNYVSALVAQANVVALSVHYRRATEHPLPIAYDDTWEALKWAIAHSGGDGPEEWLNHHADFQRVSVAGDSAGATLSHSVVLRAGIEDSVNRGWTIIGMVLFHPFFTNDKPDELIEIIFPSKNGLNDPSLNPGADPKLRRLGCGKVLIFTAEEDTLRDRGWNYYTALKESGWGGSVEIVETEGEGHVFHLLDPDSDKASALMQQTVSFLKQG